MYWSIFVSAKYYKNEKTTSIMELPAAYKLNYKIGDCNKKHSPRK